MKRGCFETIGVSTTASSDTPVRAIELPSAQMGLERRDAAAEARLGQVHRLGCTLEAAVLVQGQGESQKSQVVHVDIGMND